MITFANGRYVVQQKVSDEVFISKDNNLDRSVRISFVNKIIYKEAIRARLAELQTVRSPYVALIYDLVESDGKVGVVEENLTELVEVTADTRLKRLYEFCSGLSALYQAGLGHGNLVEDSFCVGHSGNGRICRLSFIEQSIKPHVDRGNFVTRLVSMGADTVDDTEFCTLRSSIIKNRPDMKGILAMLRERLAALLLRDKHRAIWHWQGKSGELGTRQRKARFAHPMAGVASATVEYDGTRFYLAEILGEVKVNNVTLTQGATLPSASVIALGGSHRPYSQRYFVTLDQSHPEVA